MHVPPKYRVAAGRLIIVVAMLCGATAGYLLGCGMALMMAANWMDQYALQVTTKDDASIGEARSVLTKLTDSRYPTCSDTEIAHFRDLVFRSDYLKDAGHIHDGKIDCSVAAGRSAWSIGRFKQQSRLDDGATVLGDSTSKHGDSPKIEVLELGDAYVVFGMNPPPIPGPVPVHLTLNTGEGANPGREQGGALGRFLHQPTDGTGHGFETLYSTRCSAYHLDCVTVSTSIHEALNSGGDLLSSCAVAGALAGILVGMGLSFLYKRKRELGYQLRRALGRDELKVVYQPVVSLETQRIVGAEALARWQDEDGNEVTPDVFVKLAEEQGFVGQLTKLVLERILRDFATILRDRPGFHISMNVAAADLSDPAFLPMLQGALQQAKVRPASLIVEITERSAADSPEAMESIRELRRMGHNIHIDDFGTGYSNLDKLLYLFADTIKIDKAFTGGIGTESVGATILPQILKMAKSLNLEVVVEGVETPRQADYFSLGDQKIYVQGWLYGRPMTAEQFVSVLAGEGNPGLATSDEAVGFTTKPGALTMTA